MLNTRNVFNKHFKDSYGWDKFSTYLLITGLLISTMSKWFIPFGIVLMVWAAWRSFSKNKVKRYQEEAAFESVVSRINYKIRGWKDSIVQKLHYKVLTCPNCSQKLRVPRHKGRITVTCKRCGIEIKAKS